MVKIRVTRFFLNSLVYFHYPGLIINCAPLYSQECPGLNDEILYGHPCHRTMCNSSPRGSIRCDGTLREECQEQASNLAGGPVQMTYS